MSKYMCDDCGASLMYCACENNPLAKDRKSNLDPLFRKIEQLEQEIISAEAVSVGMYADKCDETIELKKIISAMYSLCGESEEVSKLHDDAMKI